MNIKPILTQVSFTASQPIKLEDAKIEEPKVKEEYSYEKEQKERERKYKEEQLKKEQDWIALINKPQTYQKDSK